VCISERTAHDSEILTEYEDLASGNGAVSRNHPVSRILSEAHALVTAAGHQQVELLK
jgi:hypothetical protein